MWVGVAVRKWAEQKLRKVAGVLHSFDRARVCVEGSVKLDVLCVEAFVKLDVLCVEDSVKLDVLCVEASCSVCRSFHEPFYKRFLDAHPMTRVTPRVLADP